MPDVSPGLSDSRARELMEDWLASLSGKGTATGASNPMAVAELLHNSPRGQEWFYQRARQLLDDHSLSNSRKTSADQRS